MNFVLNNNLHFLRRIQKSMNPVFKIKFDMQKSLRCSMQNAVPITPVNPED